MKVTTLTFICLILTAALTFLTPLLFIIYYRSKDKINFTPLIAGAILRSHLNEFLNSTLKQNSRASGAPHEAAPGADGALSAPQLRSSQADGGKPSK